MRPSRCLPERAGRGQRAAEGGNRRHRNAQLVDGHTVGSTTSRSPESPGPTRYHPGIESGPVRRVNPASLPGAFERDLVAVGCGESRRPHLGMAVRCRVARSVYNDNHGFTTSPEEGGLTATRDADTDDGE